MAIGRITYPDKIDYRQEGQDDRYKITAENMNEIKRTFNDSAEGIEEAMNNVNQDIAKSEKLRTNLTKQAKDMQTQLTASIGKAGKYKIENGKLYLTDANGSFGEGIELPAQSSVFINGIVQGTINLDACLFVLEENGGETICGDYEAYIDYLAKHQSTNEESEDEIL